jgi:hypothetical protein
VDVTSTVGAHELPLAAGTADTELADPLLDGLLSYFAHWLNADLNTRLANIDGQPDVAVAADKVFPLDPGRTHAWNAPPALYLWRGPEVTRPWTQHVDERVTQLHGMYVFTLQSIPHGAQGVAGLGSLVSATLGRATKLGFHPSFSYGTMPAGHTIAKRLGIEGWQYDGSECGYVQLEPGAKPLSQARNSGGDGAVQTGFPAVRARWTVRELIGPAIPDALTHDQKATVRHDGSDPLWTDRVVDAPSPTPDAGVE